MRNYNVCVTAYSDLCGTATYCRQTPLSVAEVAGLRGVKVYPNPAADYLMIEGAAGSRATVLSVLGQAVLSAAVTAGSHTLDVSALPAGSYLLQVVTPEGQRGAVRFVRQ